MKKSLIAASALAILGIVGLAMQKSNAASAPALPSVPVTVAAPLPLPVSGSVSAQQNGAWTVGINGTPSVNIANSPTVTLSTAPSAPLLFRNADDPGRIAFQSSVNMSGQCSGSSCFFTFQPTGGTGYRLVVEHVSGGFDFIGVPDQITVSIGGSAFRVTPNAASSEFTAFDQPVLFYFDLPQVFQAFVAAAGGGAVFDSGQNVSQNITISGYILDCSAAPCAAIAH